jgi:hypothetical protein
VINFGMGGGSAEWEPQPRPDGQLSIPEINRAITPSQMEQIFGDPDAGVISQLPRAGEFRPHRALTPAEIAELSQPGGRERVEAQLRMEWSAWEEHQRQVREERRRAAGSGLPMGPAGPRMRQVDDEIERRMLERVNPADPGDWFVPPPPMPPRRPPGL